MMYRVVVIDDELTLRVTFQHVLEEQGYKVWVAENGSEGIKTCKEVLPDLVITDILMPDLDGFTTIEALRSEFPQLPIIAMSAAADSAGKDHAIRCGAQSFVEKPIDSARMMSLVAETLGPAGNSHSNHDGLSN